MKLERDESGLGGLPTITSPPLPCPAGRRHRYRGVSSRYRPSPIRPLKMNKYNIFLDFQNYKITLTCPLKINFNLP